MGVVDWEVVAVGIVADLLAALGVGRQRIVVVAVVEVQID